MISRFQSPECLRCLIVGALLTACYSASAQTVINIPPSPPVFSAGAGTTVNLLTGGIIDNIFQVQDGGILNVAGGTLNGVFTAQGARVNISGGSAGFYDMDNLATLSSQVQVTGGSVDSLHVYDGSTIQTTAGSINSLKISGAGTFADLRGGKVGYLDRIMKRESAWTGAMLESLIPLLLPV